KALVDGFLNQDTRWTCANLALVQSKHAQTFQGFVQEGIISLHHVFKEDVGALAAQLYRSGDQAVSCGVQDFTADGGGASKGDFGDALGVGQGMACFFTVAGDDVQYASGQQVTDDFHQQQDGSGRLLGGL